MDGKLESFIEATEAAGSIEHVGALLRRALQDEGFENVVFASARHGVLTDVIWADLPEGFADAYLACRWDRIDPVLRHAHGTTRAFAWDSVARPGQLTRPQIAFFEESRLLGVQGGLTVPLHGPGGGLDLLSVSMRRAEAAPRMRLRLVHALALQAWLRRADLQPAEAAPAPALSSRELECLKWLKDGKSNWEIGQILTISEKTVEFHVGNVLRKFHAESRLAAVMFALRAGLLEL